MAKKPAAKPPAPTYPVNPALESAVIAHAEEDTPRLVYADWLDENGDPDRAEFIRAQVTLWEKHPADPDFVTLTERKRQLLPALGRRFLHRDWSSVLTFGGCASGEAEDNERAVWHRGFSFLYCNDRAGGPIMQRAWNEQLATVIRTTTVRGLLLVGGQPSDLAAFAVAPESRLLVCLGIGNESGREPFAVSPLEPVLTTGEFPRLSWFITTDLHDPRDFALLRETSAFPRLRRFACKGRVDGRPDEVRNLFRAPWCSRLHRLEVNSLATGRDAALLDALPLLPELHTLEVNYFPATGFAAFARKTLPALGRLRLGGHAGPVPDVTALVTATLPRLTALELPNVEWTADQLLAVTQSPVFEHLRVLSLDAMGFGPAGFAALGASPSAATLRALYLTAPAVTPDDLIEITRHGAFPNLSTLEFRKSRATITNANSTVEFAHALRNVHWPDLCHRDLSGCPLGDLEAVALAYNPTLTNLRALNLRDTGIGAKGIAAIVSSPYLQKLISLCLSGCSAGSCHEPLTDPTLLPRLVDCALPRDVSATMRAQLDEARPGVFH